MKQFKWPLIVIALILAVGLGKVYFGKSSNTVLNKTSNDVAMTDWKTYTNDNIVYTFSYPQDITLSEGNMIKLLLKGPSQKESTELYDGIMLNFSLPFKIEELSLSDYVDQQIEKSLENAEVLEPKTEISINGLKGYTYTAQGLGIHKYIFLQSPEKSWTVEIINSTSDPSDQGFEKTVNKILKTFKFTN